MLVDGLLLAQDLEFEKGSHEEAYSLAQAQQSKLLRVTELENEITQLKEENKNLRLENKFQILNKTSNEKHRFIFCGYRVSFIHFLVIFGISIICVKKHYSKYH